MGKVNRAQVGEALELQKKRDRPIGQILTDLGCIIEADVRAALAARGASAPDSDSGIGD